MPTPTEDPEANAVTAEAPVEPQVPAAAGSASEPPPLPYSLRDRKKSIFFFWSLFILDCTAQPLGLYFGLWYGTDLSHNLGMLVLQWCNTSSQRQTANCLLLFSLHHRHHLVRWYLRIRILLSPLQPLSKRLQNPTVEC